MAVKLRSIETKLSDLDRQVATLAFAEMIEAVRRWRDDAGATLFHLTANPQPPILTAIIGGTGTGKSTLLNRLLDANISKANFRRTYTSGVVAVAREARHIPNGWLGLPHVSIASDQLPVKGDTQSLQIVEQDHPLLQRLILIDTPDLDGDTPAHHAQADRAFRWAQQILFVVTPEKYQMTELLPYYRLAARYRVGARFVMNKCEDQACVDDYQKQLATREHSGTVIAIPRDDATFLPATSLEDLKKDWESQKPASDDERQAGLANRLADLINRLSDQILSPLRHRRREIDRMVAALRAMETRSPGIDVNPLTEQLQRRLQERSVLYLIGPRRIFDRVRQTPALLARLPRTAWDLLRGKTKLGGADSNTLPADQTELDFAGILVDQMRVAQSQIEDVVRATPLGQSLLSDSDYASVRIDPAEGARIVEEELADLKQWLQTRWNATPRDTMLLLRLVKHLPGGSKLTQWAEAAPYLLAIVVATHHAFFGHIDLLILGGYSLVAWLTEHLSNEVTTRTKRTNRRISTRFERLTHDQIERVISHLQKQAPQMKVLDDMEDRAGEILELSDNT